MRGTWRRHEEARDLAAEALSVLGEAPASAAATRARALAELAYWYAYLDDAEHAASCLSEAIAVSRSLRPEDSFEHHGDVARRLMSASVTLAARGRLDESRLGMETSVEMFQRLAAVDESFAAEAASAAHALATTRSMPRAQYRAMMAKLFPMLEERAGSPAPPGARAQPKRRSRRQRRG
jgi:hypothetical protein